MRRASATECLLDPRSKIQAMAITLRLGESRTAHSLGYRAAATGGGCQMCELPFLVVPVHGMPLKLDAILLTADLQGREPLPGQRLLADLVVEEYACLAELGVVPPLRSTGAILAGDFYADPSATLRGCHGDVGPIWAAFARSFRWVAGVLGNHDALAHRNSEDLAEWHLLDGDDVELDGMRIAGVGGIVGNPRKELRRSESDYATTIRRLLDRRPNILITHESPAILSASHQGSAVLASCLESATDLLAVGGHCHWQSPWTSISTSVQVVNAAERVVILTRASDVCGSR